MKRSEVKKSEGNSEEVGGSERTLKNNAKCRMQTETLKKFDQNASQVAGGESFIYPLE